MPAFPDQTSSPVDRLAARISALMDEVAALRQRATRIPTLDADPAAGDPTNIWRFDDGRLRVRGDDGAVQEFVPALDVRPQIPTFAADPSVSSGWKLWFNGTTGELRGRLANNTVVRFAPVAGASSGDGGTGATGGSTTTKPKPVQPAPRRYRKVYEATWARTICPRHGVETGPRLRYGRYDSTHDERRVMIGFDDAQIRADTAGARIRSVQLHMVNTDSWAYGGIDVHFGTHNKSAPPSSFSSVRRDVWSGRWPHSGPGTYWRNLPGSVGVQLRDGTVRGLVIDQPSGSWTYYGELDWSSVRLAIVYTK